MAWERYLTGDEIRKVQEAAINAGLAVPSILTALKGDIPAKYVATLAGYDMPPALRLRNELDQMNKVHHLVTGEVPLKQFVQAMADATMDAAPRQVFVETLDLIEARSASERPAAAGDEVATLRATSATSGQPFVTRDGAGRELSQEARIGLRDMTQPAGYLAAGAKAARSVFKILIHRHFDGVGQMINGLPDTVDGTGWVIGPRLAITNFHVINARSSFFGEAPAGAADFLLQAETARAFPDYLDSTFNGAGHVLGAGALLAANAALDFAMLRLPASMEDRQPLRLSMGDLRKSLSAALMQRVNVLQHPNGGPMRLGFRNNFVVVGDADVLAYLTDTDVGSSGSPVMDDRWQVVALHYGAQRISDANIELMGRRVAQENVGTPIGRVLDYLKANHPNLHTEIMEAQRTA